MGNFPNLLFETETKKFSKVIKFGHCEQPIAIDKIFMITRVKTNSDQIVREFTIDTKWSHMKHVFGSPKEYNPSHKIQDQL